MFIWSGPILACAKLRRFWVNLLQNPLGLNVSLLAWLCLYTSTTLWNLKCSLHTCYHLVVREIISRIHPTLTVVFKFARFESSWLYTACGEYCKRRCTQHTSLIWMKWKSDWELSGPSWITSSLRQPLVSDVVDRSRSVSVLYTFSCSIPRRTTRSFHTFPLILWRHALKIR